jgi:3-deoxy-D-manno-octulosonic-acid transferase
MLSCFTHFFVQNETSRQLLAKIGFSDNVTVNGDTRFDRVLEIAEQLKPIPAIETFIGNSPVIVAGSTWTEDDEELDHYVNSHPEIKFIIAPHDISEERINECLKLYHHSILFSDWIKDESWQSTEEKYPPSDTVYPPLKTNCLIINNIGMLSKLYHYATICYVGGGFGGDGVHNVLEAAVYYKPVAFGPEYEKFIEAIDLVECGGAFSIENVLELEKELNVLLLQKDVYEKACNTAGNYVKDHAGSTAAILSYLQEKRLLTN